MNLTVGFHRYILSNFNGDTSNGLVEQEVKEFDPPTEVPERIKTFFNYFFVVFGTKHELLQVRASVEGQFLSMRAHAERFGMPSPPNRIIATGGASANDSLLSSIASIFGCNVYTVQRPGQ